MTVTAQDLLEMTCDELAEHFVSIAQKTRLLDRDEAMFPVHLQEALITTRQAANKATGANRALLEVAEAFLRTMLRSDLEVGEIALRRFVDQQPTDAESLLGRLERTRSAKLSDLATNTRAHVDMLVRDGVIRQLLGGRIDIWPPLRQLASELLEPPSLQMWRRVQEARERFSTLSAIPTDATSRFATELAITLRQAQRFLRKSPILRE